MDLNSFHFIEAFKLFQEGIAVVSVQRNLNFVITGQIYCARFNLLYIITIGYNECNGNCAHHVVRICRVNSLVYMKKFYNTYVWMTWFLTSLILFHVAAPIRENTANRLFCSKGFWQYNGLLPVCTSICFWRNPLCTDDAPNLQMCLLEIRTISAGNFMDTSLVGSICNPVWLWIS